MSVRVPYRRSVLLKWVARVAEWFKPTDDDEDSALEAFVIRHATDNQWQSMLRELRAEYAHSAF